MIVDSSALLAVVLREEGDDPIRAALARGPGLIPAPVLIETTRLLHGRARHRLREGEELLRALLEVALTIEPLTREDGLRAAAEVPRLGKGNGGPLNLVDLMVYAVAARTGLPVLCAGPQFAAAGLLLHHASRRD